ncbi:MAG: tRNA (adenosine(37)-N6)-threonylcarbamoyltransferase complex ATPase subunit type 1 TsaE [Elusimicrobia bacterium]|nr:tRNA (adenosine(37)-N6)-threonylcarbamoyltransferase complex ATPase subunit type 1 TsaE [Elusimicrobiota bacterium]
MTPKAARPAPQAPGPIELVARGEEETRRIAALVGARSRGGDIVCLEGPLGSGKTTFAQGFARGAGFKGQVASPTFAIARRYKLRRATLHHLDLFRLETKDLPNVALEETFDDAKAICLVEWPEVARRIMPEDRLEVRLSHEAGARRLFFAASGPRSGRLLAALGDGPL